jgi:hypothetical protein
VKISERFFTPAVKQRAIDCYHNPYLHSAMPYYCTAAFGKPPLPKNMQLPDAKWEKVIPDAPLVNYQGPCPLCGEPFTGVTPKFDDAHTAETKCCRRIIFSHAEDIPDGYPVSYDSRLSLPYADGSVHTFDYPSATNEAIFLPAGIISAAIQRQLIYRVIPTLALQVLMNNDADAAAMLASVLDRQAGIFGALPWLDIDNAAYHPFATYADIPEMLPSTLQQVADTFRGDPDAFIIATDYGRLNDALLRAPIGTYSGTVRPAITVLCGGGKTTAQGVLAEGWDAITDHPEARAYSLQQYGDASTLKTRVVDMLRTQSAYVRHSKLSHGNFVISDFSGAVSLAVVTKDQAMADNIVDKIFTHLWNHYFAEGISHEGAFNYSRMMSQAFDPIVAKEAFGVDFTQRYPWVNTIYRTWDFPIVTLLNIESTHGDEHAAFFASTQLPPPETVAYTEHERSLTFPEYGLTCLRAGEPASRLEVIMSHQNGLMHTDPDRLAIQLFYEGVNLLPDIGYMTKGSNVGKAETEIIKSEFPILPEPLKKRFDYNDSAEAHCNALINGNQFGLRVATFERFYGGQSKDEAGYLAQFIQVDGSPVYADHIEPVDIFSRQLLTVNFADGRPIVFDLFRLHGGRRHTFFWHVPALPPTSSLGDPTALVEPNLHDYFNHHADPKPGWRKEEDPFNRYYNLHNWPYKDDVLKKLTDPVSWHPDRQTPWNVSWHVDPQRYAPEMRHTNEAWAAWSQFQRPVTLRIWGVPESTGQYKETILGAMGPWGADYVGFGGLQFGNALSYLVENRQGTTNLASTFAHLLEPYTESQGPTLKKVDRINPVGDASSDGRAVRVETTSGETAYVATTLNSASFVSEDFQMAGRAGVVLPRSRSIWLYDGTSIQAEGLSLTMEATATTTLVALQGDLTAEPTESSLYVKSSHPIPTNGILNGQTITVLHQTGQAHTMGYKIENITQEPDNVYRIDLADSPRFTQYRMRVEKYSPTDSPLCIVSDRENLVGCNQPYLIGRKIFFPRSGFGTTITGTTAEGYRAYHTSTWFLADQPPADAIRNGDPVIIYAMQPGDTVIIPSFFACRQSPDAKSFTIQSSGHATLELPGDWPEGGPTLRNLGKERTAPDDIVIETTPSGIRLQIAPGTYQMDAAIMLRESTML